MTGHRFHCQDNDTRGQDQGEDEWERYRALSLADVGSLDCFPMESTCVSSLLTKVSNCSGDLELPDAAFRERYLDPSLTIGFKSLFAKSSSIVLFPR